MKKSTKTLLIAGSGVAAIAAIYAYSRRNNSFASIDPVLVDQPGTPGAMPVENIIKLNPLPVPEGSGPGGNFDLGPNGDIVLKTPPITKVPVNNQPSNSLRHTSIIVSNSKAEEIKRRFGNSTFGRKVLLNFANTNQIKNTLLRSVFMDSRGNLFFMKDNQKVQVPNSVKKFLLAPEQAVQPISSFSGSSGGNSLFDSRLQFI
ncbi:MAG: hypothetical protein AAF363_15805 [Bacteroidota bacterium]